MANGRIDRTNGGFNAYANSSVTYLDAVDPATGTANYVRLGIIVAQRNGWASRKNTWNDKYASWSNPALRTGSIIKQKNNARRDFIIFVQPLLNIIAANPAITEDDYAAFNIKKRDTKPTARPQILTEPYPKLKPMGGGKVKVVVRVEDDESRPSMQPDANSIQVKYTIGTTPPANEEEAEIARSYKRATRIFSLGQANAGQWMYAFFRWQNETDESKSGPWSTIVETVIA